MKEAVILIGMINVLTGPQADAGIRLDNGVKAALKTCDAVAGRKVQVIRRDTGGADPELARRLAQDLVARDKVDILAGFLLAPNALAAAEVSAQAKKVVVVMHPGGIAARSPYVVSMPARAAGMPSPEFQAGYDGMRFICEALRRTGGSTDADALLAAMRALEVRGRSPD